jgi:hypothetical protein
VDPNLGCEVDVEGLEGTVVVGTPVLARATSGGERGLKVTVSRLDRGARKDAAGTPDMLACGEEMDSIVAALIQPTFRARHEAGTLQ